MFLRNVILKISPDAQEEIKYGGLVFNVDAELICGIFIRKNHFSVINSEITSFLLSHMGQQDIDGRVVKFFSQNAVNKKGQMLCNI